MAEFSDLASKLGAPSKKSQFERQKAEAEAKKAREKAETAAVLAEFEKSFDDDDTDFRYAPVPSRGPPAPGKRHFTSTNLKSGPGSLGPAFKKRPFDDFSDRRGRDRGHQSEHHLRRDEQEQEDEKAAKPTLHLASMPPSSSPAFIKGLFAHTPLNVDNVRILPTNSTSGASSLRRSSSAIVTLAAETPATDIDTVVSHLQNRYLGYGFKLSISRHLSSAALSSTAMTTNAPSALPFGARPIAQNVSLSRAPPPNQRFAPPQSYNTSSPYPREAATQVIVRPPSDLKQLKLIHKTLEALLTYGPEFEALLMSRPEIQREEKWSWLWDSSTAGGIYYRWRLWSILTKSDRKNRPGPRQEIVFEGESVWHAPDHSLRFEYITQLDDFVSDEDYNSSDEEDEDEGRGGDLARRYNDHNTSGLAGIEEGTNDGMGYLDPLAKAKLMHLLSRLPDVNTKLRRGDVARITAFAIQHAGAGGDEVAALITRNVVRPFSVTDSEDNTSASMVGLYVISDILSCSASAGVRHAWRYRTLFEQALRQQKVFERLGRAEKTYKWGKLKGEKWKRSVQSLLSLWEGWSVFPQTAQEEFSSIFNIPPLTEEEQRLAAETDITKKTDDDDDSKSKIANRWKTVEEDANADVSMDDVDGTPMVEEDEDMESGLENIDGVSMADSSEDETDTTKPVQVVPDRPVEMEPEKPPALTPPARRQRPKAADLFS